MAVASNYANHRSSEPLGSLEERPCLRIDVRGITITTRPTVSAWADGQFVGDAREEKLLNGFGSEDQAALPFRTTSPGLHEAVRARVEVPHDPIIAQTRWQRRSFFPLSTTNTFHKNEPLPVQHAPHSK